MIMNKLIIFLLSIFVCVNALAITDAKSSKQTESLNYDVYYHWGIIWKKAGQGSLNLYEETTKDDTKRLYSKLTGKTLSFIEYIMAVRDTLECWYSPDYVPLEFVKKTNEGSYKAIERNYYHHLTKNGNELTKQNVDSTNVELRRWRNKKGNDSKKYSTSGIAYDMLSSFYLVRNLDFEKMNPGSVITFPVFAGIKMQTMRVKYIGKSSTKLRNGKKLPAYKCEMAIKTKGEEGAPLHVWFSTDAAHRPLNVIIQLRRIGSIQCELVE